MLETLQYASVGVLTPDYT